MHVDQLLSFDSDRFIAEQEKHHAIVSGLYEEKEEKGGSLLHYLISKYKGETDTNPSMEQLRREAYLHIFSYLLMFFGTLLGVVVLGITISWNLLTFEAYGPMKRILSITTLTFQSSFFVLATAVQERASMWMYLDVIILVLSALADWNFFASALWGRFGSVDLFISIVLIGYMVLRYWTALLKLKHNPIRSAHKRRNGFEAFDKVQLVWTTRSPTLISQMYPDLEAIWNKLVDKFGEAFARRVCEITIYCTSKDDDACEDLEFEVENSQLYKMGGLKFTRPSFPRILEQHTTKRMIEFSLPASRSLVAFCGSPGLGNFLKEAKIMNDLAMFVAGVDEHVIDLVIESYGGTKPKVKEVYNKEENKNSPFMPLRGNTKKNLGKPSSQKGTLVSSRRMGSMYVR